MDHITHTTLLWILAGGAAAAVLLWLALLSSMEGERLGPELDRVLDEGSHRPATRESAPEVAAGNRATDRFRVLGDPEYGLFLDGGEAQQASVTSAA